MKNFVQKKLKYFVQKKQMSFKIIFFGTSKHYKLKNKVQKYLH
jgi:hypothetical protein